MKRGYKELVAELETLGFGYDRTNSKGVDYYTHPLCREVGVSTNSTPDTHRNELRSARRSLGIDTSAGKRNPQQIKLRHAAERAAIADELNRHEAEVQTIRLAKLEGLDGAGARLAESQIRALEDKIRELRIRDREIIALMGAPTPGGDRAKHRSGGAA